MTPKSHCPITQSAVHFSTIVSIFLSFLCLRCLGTAAGGRCMHQTVSRGRWSFYRTTPPLHRTIVFARMKHVQEKNKMRHAAPHTARITKDYHRRGRRMRACNMKHKEKPLTRGETDRHAAGDHVLPTSEWNAYPQSEVVDRGSASRGKG